MNCFKKIKSDKINTKHYLNYKRHTYISSFAADNLIPVGIGQLRVKTISKHLLQYHSLIIQTCSDGVSLHIHSIH